MGNNVCLCPDGFYGDSCEITSKLSSVIDLTLTR